MIVEEAYYTARKKLHSPSNDITKEGYSKTYRTNNHTQLKKHVGKIKLSKHNFTHLYYSKFVIQTPLVPKICI